MKRKKQPELTMKKMFGEYANINDISDDDDGDDDDEETVLSGDPLNTHII